ncbi:hypothetical protein WJX72_003564 [[Myrmecia] bisecta]|uniref:Uncharacterized protein n=1 Tax=[Myrmecia] bisecta TaxID=41462 RepID=A0AAW1PK87_9CHLO
MFIRQVFYGTVRFKQLIACFTKVFYQQNSGTVLRGDVHMYSLYTYLAVIRLQELTFPQFRRLIMVKDAQKMIVFLQYLFHEETLRGPCRDQWLGIYDKEYTDGLIATLLSFMPDAAALIEELQEKVYLTKKQAETEALQFSAGAGASGASQSRTTVPAPFPLSHPRPKPMPIEQPPPPPVKGQPPPPPREGPTREEKAIEAAKQRNREQAAAKYSDPRHQPFRLKTLERPSNLQDVRTEVEEQLAKELTLQPGKPKPVPPPPTAEVRLNAAAILREDALYKKKQLEEAQMIKRYEAELRDQSEFDEWHAETVAADKAAREAEIRRRRDEMAAAQEAAIRARQQLVQENLEAGRIAKEEAKALEESLQQERHALQEANRQQRQRVIEDRQKIDEAAEKLALDKKNKAEEIRRQEAEAARKLAEEAAIEEAKRRDLIMQLRAMEKAPRQCVREFDPTEAGPHYLLDEMSLVELRERVALMKRWQQEEEDRKREDNMRRKQDRQEMLMAKAANITRIRKMAQAQAHARRHHTKVAEVEAGEKLRTRQEDQALVLYDKLESKKAAIAAEKARLVAEEKRIRFEQQQQAAGASAVEETKFRELLGGARRELIQRQQRAKQEAIVYEATNKKAYKVRMLAVKTELKAKADYISAYDQKIKELTADHQRSQAEDSLRKQSIVTTQHGSQEQQRALHESRKYVPDMHAETRTQRLLKALQAGEILAD